MPTPTVADLQKLAKVDEWFPYQLDCFELWQGPLAAEARLCLYYRTGAGKSITALTCVALTGAQAAVVVAPPSTHEDWTALGQQLGVAVTAVSHAKFRMPDFKLSRTVPVIADEFHMFGGHSGKGWKKLDRLAQTLQAPLILCSATPNYNDAERCYCVQHILNPKSCRGGYLEFLYQNCKTEQNPFGMMPKVTGFLHHKDAEAYLAAMPQVVYVPDNVKATIVDIPLLESVPDEFEVYGLNRRTNRIIASQMEERHQRAFLNMIDDEGLLRDDIYEILTHLVGMASTPVILYCNSSQIAEALMRSCYQYHVSAELLTGKTSPKEKNVVLNKFKRGQLDVLIGTATLATGTDGLDKVCNTMIIVHDTDDPSLRRQLMGRILPRGRDVDASSKQFLRLVF